MYHFIIRRQMRYFYDQLNQGNYEAILRRYGTRLRDGHTFSGSHPLGGTRHWCPPSAAGTSGSRCSSRR